jgi:acyl-CoA synthetase (AMP-forming)/AMP-acid ligase II
LCRRCRRGTTWVQPSRIALTTLAALFAPHGAGAFAIAAPDRAWLTCGGLRAQTDALRAALHGAGNGRGDRVAIVLPNGPEMAAAFVTVAQVAGKASLNPA